MLPFPELEGRLRPAFLVVFGVELVLRVVVLTRLGPRRRGASRRLAWAFVAIDLLAWLSFLPLEGLMGRQLLRGLRLVRLLVLVRFVRERLADVWSVLSRREQVQQLGLVTSFVLALSFVTAVLLSNLAIDHDYDGRGGLGSADDFWDRLWWSFRQVESPDNLVPNLAGSPLLVVVSLGLTITGIFVFSYLVGLGANVVEQVVRAERRRSVGFRGHTVVVGPVDDAELLVREFVRMYAKNRGRLVPAPRIALLGGTEQPPAYLYERGFRTVVYRQGDAADQDGLERVAADLATRALFLGEVGRDGDARTLVRLSAFRAANPDARCFVELLDDAHEEVAEAIAGPDAEVLAMARVLGLFLCHHLLVPGLEGLLAELLSAEGHELYTHRFAAEARGRLLRRGGTVRFEDLARQAHARGVTLVALYLGAPGERAELWLNPTVAADARTAPEAIAWADVAGLAGVAPRSRALRELAAALVDTAPVDTAPVETAAQADMAQSDPAASTPIDPRWLALDTHAFQPPRDVLVLGTSRAVPALVAGLAAYVPGVRVRVVMSDEDDPRLRARRRRRLGLAANETSRALEGGGHLEVFEPGPGSWVSRAVTTAQERRPDATVFLADPGSTLGEDMDARVVLRVLRFCRALAGTRGMRLLVELDAEERGEHLARDLAALGADEPELTLLSTEQIRAYFLVHAAFVPGVTRIYDALLREPGGELVYVPLRAAGAPATTFGALRRSFARAGAIPLSLVGQDGTLVVCPAWNYRVDAESVAGVHCVVDRAHAEANFARAAALR
ncbi:MAG: hypothetical protein AAF447_03895 [Myxococcota bacterium]